MNLGIYNGQFRNRYLFWALYSRLKLTVLLNSAINSVIKLLVFIIINFRCVLDDDKDHQH